MSATWKNSLQTGFYSYTFFCKEKKQSKIKQNKKTNKQNSAFFVHWGTKKGGVNFFPEHKHQKTKVAQKKNIFVIKMVYIYNI